MVTESNAINPSTMAKDCMWQLNIKECIKICSLMILKGLSRDRGPYQVRIFNILCPSLIALQLDLRVFIAILLLDWHWYFERVGNAKFSVIQQPFNSKKKKKH